MHDWRVSYVKEEKKETTTAQPSVDMSSRPLAACTSSSVWLWENMLGEWGWTLSNAILAILCYTPARQRE